MIKINRGKMLSLAVAVTLAAALAAGVASAEPSAYTGARLSRVAFPVGGMGAGMFCLEGTGAISHLSIRNRPEMLNAPPCYAAICVLGETPGQNIARVVEGTPPDWKAFGRPGSGLGSVGTSLGFPRFRDCAFSFRFPFAEIALKDAAVPLTATILGWSPFTPPDADASGLPAGALEYTFTNPTGQPLRCVFSFNARNFVNAKGAIGAIDGGFTLHDQAPGAAGARDTKGAFAVFVDGGERVVVDHCWFRGGWWDPWTIAWDNVAAGRPVANPPVPSDAPGASLAVPFTLAPGESKTIRLLAAWYWDDRTLTAGRAPAAAVAKGDAFGDAPSRGRAPRQQPVSGFLGRGLVNTFGSGGDAPQGALVSPPFTIGKRYVHLLVGGGRGPNCAVSLVVDGKPARSASGERSEALRWVTWDVAELKGGRASVRIADFDSGPWGHILCDHIVQSDEPLAALKTGRGNEILNDPARVTLIADFEGGDY
ncbi:MAG: hypothetical protein LBM92_01855, partial [Opitutaceae bacterium]|nr:hypothetical protein [Opitutaceae bacterium]